MRLELKNIGQHESLEIDLPESGIVRLNGASGNGKTTVMEAMYEALYGESDDIVAWGQTSSSVKLELNNPKITITRTRGPKTLTISVDENTYKDDEAQAKIDALIGANAFEFLLCGYVKQGMEGSLLSQTPAEQLRLVQQLSTGQLDPEKVKKLLDKKRKDLETELVISDNHIKSLTEKHNDSQLTYVSIEGNITSDEASIANIDVEKCKAAADQITATTEVIVKIQAVVKRIDSSLADPLLKMVENFEYSKSQAEQSKKAMEDQIALLKSESDNIKTVDISELEAKLHQAKIDCDVYKKVSAFPVDPNLQKLFTLAVRPCTTPYQLAALLTGMTVNLKKTLDLKREEILTIVNKIGELHRLGTPRLCPHCENPLSIINGEIQKHSHNPGEANAKLKTYSELKLSTVAEIKQLEANFRIADNASITLIEYLSIDESRYLETDKLLQRAEDVIDLLSAISDAKNAEKTKLQLDLKITGINNAITMNSRVQGDQEVRVAAFKQSGRKSRTELETLRSDLSEELAKQDIIKDALNDLIAQYATWTAKQESITRSKTSMSDLRLVIEEVAATLSAAVLEKENLLSKLSGLKRAREISDLASVSSVEGIISQINSCASVFIDKLFPDDGTFITLNNTSVTQKGEERSKMSTEIFHKGKVAKKLKSLSGGEKSRAFLAFQLALAEIYKTPILLVDEGFAGLDWDNKEACLNILKDVSGERLILVIEHGAPSAFFDQIIEI